MKRFKRTAAAILAVAILCSAVSCSQKAGGERAFPSMGGAAEMKDVSDLKAGICVYKFEDDFMTLYREEIKSYLINEYGIPVENITIKNGNGNQQEQTKQIDDLIGQKVDVLILNLVQASETGVIADKCKAAGIPVVFINNEPGDAEIKRWKEEGIPAVYVGADGRQSGTYQGEIILETAEKGDFNGDGTVSYAMIMGAPESADARYRTEYSIKALEDGGMKTEKLFEQSGNWAQEKGRELAAAALSQYGKKIEVIFCNNDAMALGARVAIEEAGRTVGKDICLVGVDALEETISAIKTGAITGTVLNDYVGQSHAAAEAAVKMAMGEKTESRYTIDYVKIAVDRFVAAAIADMETEERVFDISTGAKGFSAGICMHEFEDNVMALYRTELETYLADTYLASVSAADGNGDQEEQIRQIEAFLEQGVDVLFVNPVQALAAGQIADRCMEAGVPVVFFNCEPEKAQRERWQTEGMMVSYVGIDMDAETEGETRPEGAGVFDYRLLARLTADAGAQMAASREIEAEYLAGME